MTTETSVTTAQPDGTFQAKISSSPVRVKSDTGGWVDLAPQLGQGSVDGNAGLVPSSSMADIALSDGGSGPMAYLGDRHGAAVRQNWPFGDLPAPVVDGDSATYKDVLPGVDLVQRARPSGIAQVLKVNTREALADPRVAQMRFYLSSDGSTVQASPDGKGLQAVNTQGQVMLQTAAGQWWDSRDPTSSAEGPGGPGLTYPFSLSLGQENGHQTQVLGMDTIVNAPNLAFPVYIDPDWYTDTHSGHYTYTDSAWPTTSYWDGQYTDSTVHVGYLPAAWDYTYGVSHTAHGYYQFNVQPINGKPVLSAWMGLTETWSASCTKTPVSAYVVGAISSSTTYKTEPAHEATLGTQTVAMGYSSACPQGTTGFGVPDAPKGNITKYNTWTVGLAADNETDPLSWKRFSNLATLFITYDSPPNTPSIDYIDHANWVGTPWAAGSKYTTRLSNPTYAVFASDPDDTAGGNLNVTMTIKQGSTVLSSQTVGPGSPAANTVYKWQAGKDLPSDGTYTLEAYATDPYGLKSGTMSFNFSLDKTPPPAPAIKAPVSPTSPGFTPTGGGTDGDDPTGVPGDTKYTFTLQAGDSLGTEGFIYAVHSAAVPAYPSSTPTSPVKCGDRDTYYVVVCADSRTSKDIQIAAVGPTTVLTVWAFDTVGNVSGQQSQAPVTYTFSVEGQAAVPPATVEPLTASGAAVWQNIDVTGGSPAPNNCTGGIPQVDPNNSDGTVSGTALEITASGGRATTARGVVDASHPFSASAWVCPRATTTAQAVLTQMAGPGAPAAQLGLAAGGNAVLTAWTSATTTDPPATSTAPLTANTWSFVSAVYDKVNQQMRITVTTGKTTGTWVIQATGASHVASGTTSAQPAVVVGDSGTVGASQFLGQIYHPLMVQGVLTNKQFNVAGQNFDNDEGVL
ncbi:LamG-like jellyroll fold domain-containing protein [Sinomonas atrocyanea]|uniref:LamG-like jellyroll fold domain-containing protein n=1 Tax=Sinomonas atrocyanea TaxID=37927 RepID=UPI002856E48B|nr:LamG-like jellyroll fold domain-containing protein [Sinomonas atrocyanea]MDR6623482.1 hypothetical protein [Sinomonas atrocyanea]